MRRKKIEMRLKVKSMHNQPKGGNSMKKYTKFSISAVSFLLIPAVSEIAFSINGTENGVIKFFPKERD